jgi:hypothetical protein
MSMETTELLTFAKEYTGVDLLPHQEKMLLSIRESNTGTTVVPAFRARKAGWSYMEKVWSAFCQQVESKNNPFPTPEDMQGTVKLKVKRRGKKNKW